MFFSLKFYGNFNQKASKESKRDPLSIKKTGAVLVKPLQRYSKISFCYYYLENHKAVPRRSSEKPTPPFEDFKICKLLYTPEQIWTSQLDSP